MENMSDSATVWLLDVFFMWTTMELHSTEYFGYTGNTQLLVDFGLFVEFIDTKKNTEYHQPHPLKPLLKIAVKYLHFIHINICICCP